MLNPQSLQLRVGVDVGTRCHFCCRRAHGRRPARGIRDLAIEADRRHHAALYGNARKRQLMSLNEAAGRYMVEVAQHQPSTGHTEYQLANLVDGLESDTLLSEITDN